MKNMKKLNAMILSVAMISSIIFSPVSEASASALNEKNSGDTLLAAITRLNQYTAADGSTAAADITAELEYGVGGKSKTDDSAHIINHPQPTANITKNGSHKQFYLYSKSNYQSTGYIIMEANVFPSDINAGSFSILTSNNAALSQVKSIDSIGIKPGQWNHIRAVVNMNTASLSSPYRYPDVTVYVNGTGYDISKGASSSAINYYNPGRMIFTADSTPSLSQNIYWDDCKVYKTTENPGAQAMPLLAESESFTVSDNTLTLTGNTAVNSLSTQDGCNIRVYDDNTYTQELSGSISLKAGNIIVVADDSNNFYNTYSVKESKLLAYMNGNTVSGLTSPEASRFSGEYKSGLAGSAQGDISLYTDAGGGTKRDAVYYNYSYTMAEDTAKYLAVELNFYPEYDVSYTSIKTAGHNDITPRLNMSDSSGSYPVLQAKKWNKIVYVIENRHIAEETTFSTTEVDAGTAKSGKHRLTVFVNGEEVISDYTMPYFGFNWDEKNGNELRIGHTSSMDSANSSITAYDDIRIYEMDEFNKSDFTKMPSLDENILYKADNRILNIYANFSATVNDLNTSDNAEISAYADEELTDRLDDDAELCDGNIVAVADADAVTYYTVSLKSSDLSTLAKADTVEEWQLLNEKNTIGTVVQDVTGKAAGDGAVKLSFSDNGSSVNISCWENYNKSDYLYTIFNVYSPDSFDMTLSSGSNALGTVSLEAGKWSKIAIVCDPSAHTADLYVNGVLKNSADGINEYDFLSLSADDNTAAECYIDDFSSFVSEIKGAPKYTPGKINSSSGVAADNSKIRIIKNAVRVSDLSASGNILAYRGSTLLSSDDYIDKDDTVFVSNNSDIATYTVDYLTLNYSFANSSAGCAKGTISAELSGAFADNTAVLYWADISNGVYTPLSDYTALKTFTGTELENGYTVTKDLFIPETASALIARISYENSSFDIVCDIPELKRITPSEPETVIALTSDYHFGSAAYFTQDAPHERHYAARDHINTYADAVVVNGDFTTAYGAHSSNQINAYKADSDLQYTQADWTSEQLSELYGADQFEIAKNYFKGFTKPVYMVEGNHETPEGNYTVSATNGATTTWRYKNFLTDWINYSEENGFYPDAIQREYLLTPEEPDVENELATFYDDYVKGYHFIFLRMPHNGGYSLTQQELDFLDRKLYENEESNKPVFVFSHVPYTNTIGMKGSYQFNNQFVQTEFKNIIDRHPNVIVVSGHTHFDFNNELEWTINGKQCSPAFVHDGAVGAKIYPYDEDRTNDVEDRTQSTGVYAEIYDNHIVTRAYDYVNQTWISQGVNQITRRSECNIDDISVKQGSDETYTYLTAYCDTENVTYTWIIGGEEVTGNTIPVSADYDGFIAVRATDTSGNYKSNSYISISQIPDGGPVSEYDEGRTDYAKATASKITDDSNAYIVNPIANADSAWETGIGGKSSYDESFYTEYNGKRIYAVLDAGSRFWTQKNSDSKYLVISMNAMVTGDDDCHAYFGTSGGNPLSAKTGSAINKYQWNKIVAVYNIESKSVDTYVNGEKLSPPTATVYDDGSDLRFTIESAAYTDTLLKGYFDDIEIYETSNEPMLTWAQDAELSEYGERYIFNKDKSIISLTANQTVADVTEELCCTVSTAKGITKESSAFIETGDMAVYYDSSANAYKYYTINILTDFMPVFKSGVSNNEITDNNVSLLIPSAEGNATAIIAQYNTDDSLNAIGLYELSTGITPISFTPDANSSAVKIMAWDNMSQLIPKINVTNLTIK